MKITKTQQKALDKMKDGEWYSPYDLKEKISTLKALVRKKILVSQSGVGRLFFTRTSTLFKKR